jgi:TonB family protein
MQHPLDKHSPTYLIGLNNEGVCALKCNNYPKAIKDFETTLSIDPGYEMARDNLRIAYNNYGLSLRHTPAAALHQFHEALWLNPGNKVVQQVVLDNVGATIKMLHFDPNSSIDRLQLAENELSQFDLIGYLEEAYISRWLKRNPGHDWKDALSTSFYEDQSSDRGTSMPMVNSDTDVNCTEARVQRVWNKSQHPYGASKVRFGIKRDGSLVDLHVEKSSGSPLADNAALDAVRKCAPFAWPTNQSVPQINLELDFVADADKQTVSGRRIN